MDIHISVDEIKLEEFYILLSKGVPPPRDFNELTEEERQKLWFLLVQIKLL